MTDLKTRQTKIQEIRKHTDWKDFIKEFGSRYPLVFYKNNGLISRYPDTDRIKGIISHKKFNENLDLNANLGFDYDLNNDFFENYGKLYKSIDWFNLVQYDENENCDFADTVFACKNIYLSFCTVLNAEDVLYSFFVKDNAKDVLNSVMVWDCSENIYMSTAIIKSFKVFFSKYIINSSEMWFCLNCTGCQECILCEGLENQSYCFKNKQYSKEDYYKLKAEVLRNKSKFLEIYQNISEKGNNIGSDDVDGNFILYSENIKNGNFVYQVKEGRNLFMAGGEEGDERYYDCIMGGTPYSSDYYGNVNFGGGGTNVYLCEMVAYASNMYYCSFCWNCSHCLGCVGLQNKQFCILNKEYEKEEWEELICKIFAQMENDGILGDFFPASMNPFYFNDTVANLIEDYNKEDVIEEGYLRRDDEIKVDIPEGQDVISTNEFNDYQGFDEEGNWKIDPEIMKKVILDDSGNYYRIVKMEYDFLMKHGLPIPEIHWLNRIKLGFKFN